MWKKRMKILTGKQSELSKQASMPLLMIQGSQDWAEMLKAISYATGVSTDNMTVLWLGNNGSPQDAKGKILDKATGNKYQVTITWVDEKGWKPTKVEKLK